MRACVLLRRVDDFMHVARHLRAALAASCGGCFVCTRPERCWGIPPSWLARQSKCCARACGVWGSERWCHALGGADRKIGWSLVRTPRYAPCSLLELHKPSYKVCWNCCQSCQAQLIPFGRHQSVRGSFARGEKTDPPARRGFGRFSGIAGASLCQHMRSKRTRLAALLGMMLTSTGARHLGRHLPTSQFRTLGRAHRACMSEAIPRGGAQGAFFGPPPPPPLTDQLLLAWEQPPRLESDADLMDQAQKRQGAGAELMVRTLMSMTRNGGAPRPGTSAMASSADAAAISDISALLKSKVVKGIGPKLASSLISQFGARTLDVLRGNGDDEEQKRLLAIPGLGEKTLARIRESVATWESLRDGLRFCRTLGLLSESQVGALVSVHAERTEEVVRRNPYILLELFPRLRFGSVDVVARSEILGVLPDSPERARACIQHNLRRALNNGHCCVPQDRLLKAVARELAIETALRPAEAIKVAEKALVTLVNLGALVQEAPPPLPGSGSDDFLLDSAEPGSNRRSPPKRPFMLSLAPMHAAERHVAQAVRRRLAMPTTAEGGFDLTFGIYSGRLSDESERADDAAGCNDDYADEEAASGEGGGGGRLAGGVSFSASIFGGAGDEAAEAGEAALRGGEDGTIPDANLGVELGSDLASDLASELASAAQQPRSPPPSPRLPLSEMQRAAVERAALSKLMLLTGGPGTGKTYTVRAIVEQWTAQGKTVLLACPPRARGECALRVRRRARVDDPSAARVQPTRGTLQAQRGQPARGGLRRDR